MTVYYMHTINSKPAFFDGCQICYMNHGGRTRAPNRLAASLDQIREERAKTAEYRRRMGFSDSSFEYGYVRVTTP